MKEELSGRRRVVRIGGGRDGEDEVGVMEDEGEAEDEEGMVEEGEEEEAVVKASSSTIPGSSPSLPPVLTD